MPRPAFLDGLRTALPGKSVALSQTLMAQGALTLVPPSGFCIDRNTLRQDFALMARCDTLGVSRLAGGAPLGLITVSVTPLAAEEPLPTAQSVAEAANLSRVDAEKSENTALTFRAEGAPPGANLDALHWRGLARVRDQLMGIAFYGPEGSRAISPEGREIINELIRNAQIAS